MKNLYLIILLIITIFPIYSGNKDDVILTVTSDGATKDDAIKNALREAVEQTYGVFVSANTSILNDDLIEDEIATVSSGNIKKYKEIAYSHNGNNNHTVTLNVVVSKGKLLKYAKSKGAECELDGASMFADMQLQELFRQNEEKLFENLIAELEGLFKQGYDYELEIKNVSDKYRFLEPVLTNQVAVLECHITAKLNRQGELAWDKLMETLNSVGQKYNIFESKKEEGFNYEIEIATGNSGYYSGSDIENEKFLLRSKKSHKIMQEFLFQIPDYIRNIRLDLNGEKINCASELEEWYNVVGDAAMSRYNRACPYRKKEGYDCGQFRYILKIPWEDLKNTTNIKIEQDF